MEINKIDNFEDFYNLSKNLGIKINNNQLELFKKHYKLLLEWNKKINLISRKEENILEKHFLDSILFLPEFEKLDVTNHISTTVLDIGSGGGFPGIPLAIMKPEWNFTLCESTTKKAKFLISLVKELELKNTRIINDRVENIASKFNLVTARAVAKLDILIKYALPLLKPKGFLLAYKAKEIDCEIKVVKDIYGQIKKAQKIIKKNDLKLKIFTKELNGVQRKLVAIQLVYS